MGQKGKGREAKRFVKEAQARGLLGACCLFLLEGEIRENSFFFSLRSIVQSWTNGIRLSQSDLDWHSWFSTVSDPYDRLELK
jgi:hypothetical protein